VLRTTYPPGVAGVKLSLQQIAQRIREGALSPKVQGVAFDALLGAGFAGRGANAGGAHARASALLSFVRQHTLYAPDPPGVEYMKSAEAMLCLAPNLCIRGGDCDDQLILLGSMVMGVGIPVQVLKQTFGVGDQEHVLLEAQDDSGQWFPLDPSSDMPAGRKAYASEEYRLDPSNPTMIGLHGAPDAEFIGVGGLGNVRFIGDTPTATTAWTTTDIVLGVVALGIATGLAAGFVQRERRKRRR
jgi:transglutaminase-like putative cysteine protease